MKYLTDSFYDNIDLQIVEIENKNSCKILISNLIIEKIEEIILDMNIWLKDYTFESPEVEIHFFKIQKPRLVTKLIFNIQILEIESNLPSGKAAKKKFYSNKIQYYNLLNQKNNGFFQYFRAKKTKHDAIFFIRKLKSKKIVYFDGSVINYDNQVCTTHDYLIAQIASNDLIIKYLEDKIDNLDNKNIPSHKPVPNSLKWTGNKIELIELLYALQHSNSINNGNSEIKELASKFGQFLNIEIEENIYRNYIDIKNRKTDKTKFLNTLSQNLSNFIELGEN